jgi:hypothetical protein
MNALGAAISTGSPITGAYFEYSTDPAIEGAQQTGITMPDGLNQISSVISGLSPSTYYYVRAVGTSAAGTAYSGSTYGGVGVIAVPTATAANWPVASTVQILTFSSTSANLEGSFASTTLPAVIHFEYDTDLNFTNAFRTPDQTIGPTGGEPFGVVLGTATVTGLSPATDYFYRAVATNSAGTSIGIVMSFRTNP